MNKTILNFALALSLTVSAFALDNVFSISTDSRTSYVDNGYNGGELTIKGQKLGSTSSNVQLRIETFRKVGSSVQLNRYVSNIAQGTQLPTQVRVYNSNSSWGQVGSRNQGLLDINLGDGSNLSGVIFNRSFNANIVTR